MMKYCEFGGCFEEIENWKSFCEEHFTTYRDHDIDTCLRCGRFKRKMQEFCSGCDASILDQTFAIENLIHENLSISSSDLDEYPMIFLDDNIERIFLLFQDGYVRTINLEMSLLKCSDWSYENFSKKSKLVNKCILVGAYYVFGSTIDYYSLMLLQNKEENVDILTRLSNLFIGQFFPKIFDSYDYVSYIPSKISPDHMEHIAQGIATYYDVECWTLPIKRTSSRHSRDHNWEKGPLYIENTDKIEEYRGDSILIVDDIITRGRSIINIKNILYENDVSCTFLCLSKTNNAVLSSPKREFII